MSNITGYQFISIDPLSASKEEIQKEIKRLESQVDIYKNKDIAFKLILNSTYGAIGNNFFICFNKDVAESITLQGQDLIKHSEILINEYFQNEWNIDNELHKKMGLVNVSIPFDKLLCKYGDTDSMYISFESVITSCDFKGSGKEFIHLLYKHKLKDYLNNAFEIYAKERDTENIQQFELENISESTMFFAKKKYVSNIIWEDPIDVEPFKNIKAKGIELAQSSTPKFAREKLKEFLKYIFVKKKKDFNLQEFIKMLKKTKEEFKLQDIDDISETTSIGDYRKSIINDTTKFEIASGCPMHVRGSGLHNYLLNSSKFKGKYELIRSGDKVKHFYVVDKYNPNNNCFAYKVGNYPYEFAPQIDYDLQFSKQIIDPINRFIRVLGYPDIPSSLVTVRKVI